MVTAVVRTRWKQGVELNKNKVMMHAWPVPPVSVGVYVQAEVVPCCKEGK